MANRPKVIKYVLNAIVELGDKNGSPLSSIIDLVRTNIAIDNVRSIPRNIAVHARRALQTAIEEGLVIEPTRGRYKIVVDDEDNLVPRVCSTIYRNQCPKSSTSDKSIYNLDKKINEYTKLNHYDKQYDEGGNKLCSRCGGKRRCKKCGSKRRCNKCVRNTSISDRCRGKRPCKRRRYPCGCGSGSCGECRPPPIPRTPCTPPTPRQPCPPNPPCPPKTPCDYFENEGFDHQASTYLEEDKNHTNLHTTDSLNLINTTCRRSTDSLPPDNENKLDLRPNCAKLDSDRKELSITKLYFGPTSLGNSPIIISQEPQQMDSTDTTTKIHQ